VARRRGARLTVTFSLLGRCARTGQLGACTATSDIAVGARVPHAKALVGAALTQHRTDPLLGSRGLDLLESGCGASMTIDALVASTSHHPWRQLAVVDSAGRTAAFSGSRVRPPYAEEHGDGCVALGNMLVSQDIGPAMTEAFAAAEEEPLAERLLRALEAGQAAGGEQLPRARQPCSSSATTCSPSSISASTFRNGRSAICGTRGLPTARSLVSSSLAPSIPTTPTPPDARTAYL
jgi:uncharacterized Ntn-hydrolase superfamily protein